MEFTSLTNENNSVCSYYSNNFINKTIIRNEFLNKYMVFETKDEFLFWYNKQNDKYCHEVIFGNQIQRFKMDIDIYNINNINIVDFINNLIDIIINIFNKNYSNICLSYKDIIVTDSSGQDSTNYKYSYHIIVFTYGLLNNIECKFLTKLIIDSLPTKYHNYIDKNVNKNIQNFRILDSCKLLSKRVKKISNKFNSNVSVNLVDTLIIPKYNIKILDTICNEENINNEEENINDNMVNKILKCLPSTITNGHVIREVKNNGILYNRIKPTYCELCKEIHHNDNSLIIQFNTITKKIYEYCRQKNDKRFICFLYDNEINNDYIEFNNFDNCNKNIYSNENMKKYELVPTLVVKGQMKIGKTKMLYEFIKENFNNNDIIKFISFRQTFSNNIQIIFNDFELYSNIKENEILSDNYKRLIIQVESLYRISDNNITDLLVLDEIESIISQISSGLHKQFNASLATFIWLLKTAKHVICLDANISNRSYNILKQFRGQHEIFYHCNDYKTSKDDKYYITKDVNIWISHLKEKINNNKNIVIVTNSINEAKICEQIVKNINNKLVIKLFSSESKSSEKNLYFNNVNKYWIKINVLIYTPTCTAGINFELEHFDTIFGNFCNTSCDVETCRQMLGRVRNVKSKEYYIYLKEIKFPQLPVTKNEIVEFLYNKRENLYKEINDKNLQWYYNDEKKIKFYETDYLHIWIQNTIVKNLSKNNFIDKFIYQIKDTGATVNFIDNEINYDNSDYKNIKKYVKENYIDQMYNSPNITDEEAFSILNKIRNQNDIEKNDLYSYKKFKLKEYYQFNGNITKDFIKLYDNDIIKNIYKNLCDISYCETIYESINHMMTKELQRYETVISSENKNNLEYYDLHNDSKIYSSMKHKIFNYLFKKINNNINIPIEEYDQLIGIYKDIINNNKKFLSIELNILLSDDTKKDFNKLIKIIYGLRFYKQKNYYQLKKCNNYGSLFIFTEKKSNNNIVEIITKNKLFLSLN